MDGWRTLWGTFIFIFINIFKNYLVCNNVLIKANIQGVQYDELYWFPCQARDGVAVSLILEE